MVMKNNNWQKNKELFLICVFVVCQLIYVFLMRPYVSIVSDENLYILESKSLLLRGETSYYQYPFLYPLILTASFLAGNNFYYGMLVINIIIKACSLLIISKLLKKIKCKEDVLVLALIAFSPVFFMWSRTIMAENLMAPLFLINILVHIAYRNTTIKNTILAALLSWLVFMTKYLAIVLLPIFCLFFSIAKQRDVNNSCDEKHFFIRKINMKICLLYTFVVIACILLYSGYVSFMTESPVDFTLFKRVMGLEADQVIKESGYNAISILSFNMFGWMLRYLTYVILGICPLLVPAVLYVNKKKICSLENLFLLFLVMCLIFVAARHSTTVAYNQGGIMVKLMGRYVSYATPIFALALGMNLELSNTTNTKKSVFAFIGASGGVLISYILLYTRLLWKYEDGWLAWLRGLESIGYWYYGKFVCLVICLLIFAMIFVYRKKSMLFFIVICTFLLHPIASYINYDDCWGIKYYNTKENMIGFRALLSLLDAAEYRIITIDGTSYDSAQRLCATWILPDAYQPRTIPASYREYEYALQEEGKETIFMLQSSLAAENVYDKSYPFCYVKLDDANFYEMELDYDVIQKDGISTLHIWGLEYGIVVYNGIIKSIVKEDGNAYVSLEGISEGQLQIYDFSKSGYGEIDLGKAKEIR